MIHPLLRLAATQPQLLADHAEAYAGLMSEEIAKTASRVKMRLVYAIVALALFAVGVVLAGVALMLWGALPAASFKAPWALLAAPAVPLVVALVCAMVAAHKPPDAFTDLKQQLHADLSMLREAGAPA